MGCDIHTMAEIKKNGSWEMATDRVFKNDYYKTEPKYDWEMEEFETSPSNSRNYKLFGFLANVRNGYGFAGVDTGEAIEPIDDPRGVPEDASKDWKAEVYDWGGGMHSQSYFTLKELEEADWEQKVVSRMYVSPKNYEAFKKTGNVPDFGWGGGSGMNVTGEEYEQLPEEDKALVHGVQIEWTETIGELTDYWKDGTLNGLRKLAEIHNLNKDEVRIVFGFDN